MMLNARIPNAMTPNAMMLDAKKLHAMMSHAKMSIVKTLHHGGPLAPVMHAELQPTGQRHGTLPAARSLAS